MPETTYLLSFTTGGLFYREASKVAQLYLESGDWDATRAQVLAENLLQTRTRASAVRTFRELSNRLQALTPAQFEILVDGSRQEQNHMLWLAACKQYRFVREFAREVLRQKFLRLDPELTYLDFDIFYNDKAEWSDELDQLADTTRKKLRQVLFRMMTEAGLLSKTGRILPPALPPRVADCIAADDPTLFEVFPVSDLEIRKQVRP